MLDVVMGANMLEVVLIMVFVVVLMMVFVVVLVVFVLQVLEVVREATKLVGLPSIRTRMVADYKRKDSPAFRLNS